jgi:hypothetical protein
MLKNIFVRDSKWFVEYLVMSILSGIVAFFLFGFIPSLFITVSIMVACCLIEVTGLRKKGDMALKRLHGVIPGKGFFHDLLFLVVVGVVTGLAICAFIAVLYLVESLGQGRL